MSMCASDILYYLGPDVSSEGINLTQKPDVFTAEVKQQCSDLCDYLGTKVTKANKDRYVMYHGETWVIGETFEPLVVPGNVMLKTPIAEGSRFFEELCQKLKPDSAEGWVVEELDSVGFYMTGDTSVEGVIFTCKFTAEFCTEHCRDYSFVVCYHFDIRFTKKM